MTVVTPVVLPAGMTVRVVTPTSTDALSGGVRIVDMPDLGMFTSDSSVVGEKSGSGRFSASALISYFNSATAANVVTYGAIGDGIALDANAINRAASAIPAGGGVLLFPAGRTYRVDDTILLKSGTIVYAYGATIVAHTSWQTPTWYGVNLGFANVNYLATSITDSNISILGGYYDWRNRTADHVINFRCVRNTVVRDVRTLGGGVAIEHMHCDTTLVDHCYVENFVTDGIDHFDNPRNAIVRDCTIRATVASQMVTFNAVDVASAAGVGDGFIMEGCYIESTEPTATPCQIEPLPAASGTGQLIKNVQIRGNVFRNSWLVCRGNCVNFQIVGNQFLDFLNPSQVIAIYTLGGFTPDNITVQGNQISGISTTSVLGVVQMDATNWSFISNKITGAGYTAPGLNAANHPGTFLGNDVSNGLVNLAVNTVGSFAINTASNQSYGFFNTAGTWRMKMTLQTGDNFVWSGISASNTDRTLAAIQQGSDTSDWKFYPTVTLGAAGANAVRIAGAGIGNTPAIFAIGSDTNVYLKLAGQGTRGVKGTLTTTAAIPNTADLAVSEWGVYKNSTSGAVVLAVNDGGTIKSVALI